jgi:hypothetical protein
MICSEQLKSVQGGAKAESLDSNKTHAQVLEGNSGLWSKISWRW